MPLALSHMGLSVIHLTYSKQDVQTFTQSHNLIINLITNSNNLITLFNLAALIFRSFATAI